MKILITGLQIRMARGCLKWSVQKLSDEANVGTATIKRMELAPGLPNVTTGIIEKVQAVLSSALNEEGIEFVPGNGSGPGVRQINPIKS